MEEGELKLKKKALVTVHSYLKQQGFSCLKSDPTDEQARQFVNVMVLTNRSDLKFTPFVDLVYEKKVGRLSSFIVEGKAYRNRYYYDFYLAKYDWRTGELLHTKSYCTGVNNQELLYYLKKVFEKKRANNKFR